RSVRLDEGKAAVLETNASEVSAASRTASEKKVSAPAVLATATAPASVPTPSTAADEVERLYIEHRNLLLYVACRKFRIPDGDAENLIQEVFLSFLQTGTKIDNVRAWLVAAMCNASRHYWRASGRTESLPDDFNDHSDPGTHSLAEQFALQITIQQALRYLQPRCRETLRLHYFEGRSAGEVARELETTNRYAEKLIHNCLKRVREIYMNITAVNR
ncbi:MAG TPA: sigma-70 family RNA polymerase sigma factor, partial [Thermoanaerobaculia bacterium]